MKKRHIIFTKKKHPTLGIMSFILGIISLLSYAFGVIMSFMEHGEVTGRFGIAGALACIYAFAGMIMALWCFKLKEAYRLFPVLGLIFNGLAILAAAFLIWIPD